MTTALPRRPFHLVRSTDTRPGDRRQRALSNGELVARLPGVLRGGVDVSGLCNQVLVVGDLALDRTTAEVSRSGIRIELTGNEFELLFYLMLHPSQAVSRERILVDAWTYDFGGRTGVVDLYIHFLRKKIDAGRLPMIHTVAGIGYRLSEAETGSLRLESTGGTPIHRR